MKKISLKQIEIIGAVFGSLLGSLDHFVYDWTKLPWTAVFSPINESPWEHLKLYYFPIMLFLIVEWFWVADKKKLLFAKTTQIIFGMFFIIGFFYTYTGALGLENVWVDIASFILAMALGYGLSSAILKSSYKPHMPTWFWAAALIIIFILFEMMTWAPFRVPLFRDKPSGTYGIQRYI